MKINYIISEEYPRDNIGLHWQVNSIEDEQYRQRVLQLQQRLSKRPSEKLTELTSQLKYYNDWEIFERILRNSITNAIECDISGVGYKRVWYHLKNNGFLKDKSSWNKFERKFVEPAIAEKFKDLPNIWASWLFRRVPLDILDRWTKLLDKGILLKWNSDHQLVKKVSELSEGAFNRYLETKIVKEIERKEQELIEIELANLEKNDIPELHKKAWKIYRDNPQKSKRGVAREVVDAECPSIDKKTRKRYLDNIRKGLESKFPKRVEKRGKRTIEKSIETPHKIVTSNRKSME